MGGPTRRKQTRLAIHIGIYDAWNTQGLMTVATSIQIIHDIPDILVSLRICLKLCSLTCLRESVCGQGWIPSRTRDAHNAYIFTYLHISEYQTYGSYMEEKNRK